MRALLLASILGLGLVGACDLRPPDFSRLESSAERFHARWTTRLAEVQSTHQALLTRAQALPQDAAGVSDAIAQLTTAGATLAELGKTRLPQVEQDIRARIDQRQRYLAEEALRHGAEDLDAALEEAVTIIEAQRAPLDRAEQAAKQAQATDTAADLALTAGVADIVAPTFARQVGESDVLGINFKPGTAEPESSDVTKAALMRLIALANTCDQIRIEITSHTAKDGDPEVNQRLATAQAEAVRQYLLASGVAPQKIARTAGIGGLRPATPEPDAGSAEEKAMPTDQLAKIRARNRRVSVTVVQPCPPNPA